MSETSVTTNWIDQPRSHGTATDGYPVEHELDEHYSISEVKGLKLKLFPYQKRDLRAMIDLENKGFLNFQDNKRLKYNAGVLSEPVGSGKTIIILALILQQPIPRMRAGIAHWNMLNNDYQKKFKDRQVFTSIIRKKYRKNPVFKPTLVFVGLSVLDQWEAAVKNYTNLKYFVVGNLFHLKKLFLKIKTRQINDYDIIIVKNGKVARTVALPTGLKIEPKNKKTSAYIYNVLTNLRNYCWARVVNDDMDTNGLPSNAGILNAAFTWYVSSTKKKIKVRSGEYSPYNTTDDSLMYANYPCGWLHKNQILFYNLNIRSSPKFIEESNKLCAPQFFAYTFANPNNSYINLLGALDNDETRAIAEMLNGDAIESAAEAAGIKSTNVADIFQKMLGSQYERFKFAKDVLRFIDTLGSTDSRRPASQIPEDDTYGKRDLLKFRVPKYNYPGLTGTISSTYEEYTKIEEKSGLAIQRVKDNIKNGECPICCLEFVDAGDEDEDIMILKCCGIIVCSSCCFTGVFKNKRSLKGVCCRCRRNIGIRALIYISNDFDLTKIVDDELSEDEDDPIDDADKDEKEKGKDEKEKEKKAGPQTKIDAIVDIVRGVVPANEKKVDVDIANLMSGVAKLPEAKTKKVLVFSNHNESLRNTAIRLTEEKIRFWKLGGNSAQIGKISQAFSDCPDPCVLLINSVTHCAGRNFQMCSDLIYLHVIQDKSIESQVCGRGQRIGRASPLKVRYLLYKNEYDDMINAGRARLI